MIATTHADALNSRGDDTRAQLVWFVSLLCGAGLLAAVVGLVRSYVFHVAAERMVGRLRMRVFRHLLSQEVGFFDEQRSADLTTRCALIRECIFVCVSVRTRRRADKNRRVCRSPTRARAHAGRGPLV